MGKLIVQTMTGAAFALNSEIFQAELEAWVVNSNLYAQTQPMKPGPLRRS